MREALAQSVVRSDAPSRCADGAKRSSPPSDAPYREMHRRRRFVFPSSPPPPHLEDGRHELDKILEQARPLLLVAELRRRRRGGRGGAAAPVAGTTERWSRCARKRARAHVDGGARARERECTYTRVSARAPPRRQQTLCRATARSRGDARGARRRDALGEERDVSHRRSPLSQREPLNSGSVLGHSASPPLLARRSARHARLPPHAPRAGPRGRASATAGWPGDPSAVDARRLRAGPIAPPRRPPHPLLLVGVSARAHPPPCCSLPDPPRRITSPLARPFHSTHSLFATSVLATNLDDAVERVEHARVLSCAERAGVNQLHDSA